MTWQSIKNPLSYCQLFFSQPVQRRTADIWHLAKNGLSINAYTG
jgi:hypothetical protein